MALTQEQVDAWFDANPNATAEDVAAAVQSVGGLSANEGLASMIANRYSIAEPEVTNYYNAYTAPKVETPVKQDIPTFTDTILAGTPTTQEELLSVLANNTVTGGAGKDTVVGGTGTGSATQLTNTNTQPITTGTKTITEFNAPVALGDGTFRTTGGVILDANGVPVTASTTAGTSQADLLAALAAPADNITSTGGFTKSATKPTGGGVSNVIEGDDIETQIAQLPTEYASWSRSADQRTMELIRKSDGAVLDRRTVGDFSDLDLAKIGLSFIPGAGQILAGLNVVDAARRGDLLQAAIGVTGLVPGMQNVNTALRVGKAVDAGDTFGAITALAGNTDLQNLTGLNTTTVGGFTAKDAMAAGNLIQAATTGNYGAVISNLGTLTGSSDTTLAGKALSILTRLQNGDTKALGDALALSTGISGSTTGTTGTAGTNTSSAITTLTDEDLAELNAGELNAYQTGGIDGLSNFRKDMKLLTSLTNTGYTGVDNIGTTSTTLDSLTGGTGTDTVTGATGDDGTSFTKSLGTLDQLDANRTADDFADFLKTIGITNVTQLTDSGLSNQDILDLINAGTDTVTVTGTTGKDTVVDTTTGTTTNTKTGLTCAKGFAPNEAGTECIAVVDVEACKDGKVRDPVSGLCVWPKTDCDAGFHDDGTGLCVADTDLDCPEGYEPNEAGTECIPVIEIKDKKCDPGFVYDEDLKTCVAVEEDPCDPGYHRENGVCVQDECPDGYVRNLVTGACEKPLVCDEGYELNDAGTECIPKITIVDKKCDPGFVYDEDLKTCVAVKGDEPCDEGYHLENGICVANDDDKCDPGFERVSGVCVPVCADGSVRNLATGVCEKPLTCDEGYELNEAGTECIPKITIEACKDGKVRDPITGGCVWPKVECDDGFHDDGTGLCVPDDDPCDEGYHRENGVCVPDDCPTGYIRNLETGQCEKVEDKGCPPGQVKNAEGKCVPIVTPPPPPPPVVKPPIKKVAASTYSPSSVSGEGERTDPIYAGGMDDFDLFATLEELLADKPDKTDKKKDNKKSKDKTKMATGGHLDDLLAEQMTVDDLLKLLR